MGVSIPDGYTARAPGPGDAPALANLISASQLSRLWRTGDDAEELLNDWQGLDPSVEAVIVGAPDGEPAGYADVLNRGHVRVSVYGLRPPRPSRKGRRQFPRRWGERWTRDRMDRSPEGARVVVEHYVDGRLGPAQRLLERRGYTPERNYYLMGAPLDGSPTTPQWPEGIRERVFEPGKDERAAFEVQQDAFRDVWETPPSTFERFAAYVGSGGFEPSVSFLAEGKDGTLAGLILGSVVAGRGMIDVVGVRRSWRGRGLGLALLRRTLAEYLRRGVKSVELSVDAESATGAPRLYRRAGFGVKESYVLYRKELRPASSGERS